MLGRQIFDSTEYFLNIFYAIVNSIVTDYFESEHLRKMVCEFDLVERMENRNV